MLGKTRWALDQFEFPLLVRHTEDLKLFKPGQHDGLVFDDFCLNSWSAQAVIHLLDWELPSTINVKHGSVTIPAQTRKIFTSNASFAETFPQCEPGTWAAISRRIRIIHVNGPTFNKSELDTNTEEDTTLPEMDSGDQQDLQLLSEQIRATNTTSDMDSIATSRDRSEDDMGWNELMEKDMGGCTDWTP